MEQPLEKIRQSAHRTRSEFFDFLRTYGVIGMAIGIVMGGAINRFVTAVVDSLIMPLIGLLLPDVSWEQWKLTLGGEVFLVGNLLGRFIEFTAIALLVFFFARYVLKQERKLANSNTPD